MELIASAAGVAAASLTRQQYAEDKCRASYYWMAERNEITYAQEWDNLSEHDYPLKTAGFKLDRRTNDFVSQNDVTVRVHAMAHRPSDGHKNYWIDIEPGNVLIWRHVVNQMLPGPGAIGTLFEFLIFGRRDSATGKEDILVIDWDGQAFEVPSLAAAYAALTP